MAGGIERSLGRPVADAEAMRHDSRAWPQLRAQLRQQPPIQFGKEKQGHDRGFTQIGSKQIFVAELDQVLHAGLAGIAARAFDHSPIDLDADSARTVDSSGGNGNAAIAGAKIVDDVGRGHACKPKHRLDHVVRGWQVRNVSVMHFGGVGLRCTLRRSARRVRVLRSCAAGEEQRRNDGDSPACHDSVLDLSVIVEHRPDLTRINVSGEPRPTLDAMNAGDVMVKDVVVAGPEAAVREVALLMLERRISGVPVVDGERQVLGIVSEGDLIRRPELQTDQRRGGWLSIFLSDDERARDFVKTHGLRAREVMTQPAICVAPDTALAEVVRLMERHRVKRLPVLEHGKLAGLVTRTDLLRALVARQAVSPTASSDRELRDRIETMLRGEDWATSACVNVTVENGVAQLWGTVESVSQRKALILAVRRVPGVREVQAHLGRTIAG